MSIGVPQVPVLVPNMVIHVPDVRKNYKPALMFASKQVQSGAVLGSKMGHVGMFPGQCKAPPGRRVDAQVQAVVLEPQHVSLGQATKS